MKIEAGVTYEWRDEKWAENELLFARATGIGGDALSRPVTEAEAARFIAVCLSG